MRIGADIGTLDEGSHDVTQHEGVDRERHRNTVHYQQRITICTAMVRNTQQYEGVDS